MLEFVIRENLMEIEKKSLHEFLYRLLYLYVQ